MCVRPALFITSRSRLRDFCVHDTNTIPKGFRCRAHLVVLPQARRSSRAARTCWQCRAGSQRASYRRHCNSNSSFPAKSCNYRTSPPPPVTARDQRPFCMRRLRSCRSMPSSSRASTTSGSLMYSVRELLPLSISSSHNSHSPSAAWRRAARPRRFHRRSRPRRQRPGETLSSGEF